MVKEETILKSLAEKWLKDYFIYSPVKTGEILKIQEIKQFSQIDWSGAMPENPWKEILLPHTERIFDIDGEKLKATKSQQPPTMCLGMNVLDLKALALFDAVFANDAYYQNRRDRLMIIGYSADWPNDYKKYKVFSHKFEEDILEHIPFDIFIARIAGNKLKFYSGSDRGRRLLEKSGQLDFTNIKFAGAIAEEGPDKRMLAIEKKIAKSTEHALWDELDKICLACGKCSIVCPTCFCFNLNDKVDPNDPRRNRVRGNCFYNDFSKIAGGFQELNTVKKKIYFWYIHKFLRIPHEYKIPGCVSCGRCVRACPVGIDIVKNIAKILKIK